jgi:hypothetical protein
MAFLLYLVLSRVKKPPDITPADAAAARGLWCKVMIHVTAPDRTLDECPDKQGVDFARLQLASEPAQSRPKAGRAIPDACDFR